MAGADLEALVEANKLDVPGFFCGGKPLLLSGPGGPPIPGSIRVDCLTVASKGEAQEFYQAEFLPVPAPKDPAQKRMDVSCIVGGVPRMMSHNHCGVLVARLLTPQK